MWRVATAPALALVVALAAVVVIASVAFGRWKPAVAAPSESTRDSRQQQLRQKLLQVAATYQQWGRVDEGTVRWGIAACYIPRPQPSIARPSLSGDAETHGSKLYFLFARDRDAYDERSKAQPVGQVLVKQSWKPQAMPAEFRPDQAKHRFHDPMTAHNRLLDEVNGTITLRGGYVPYAEKDGRWFRADDPAGLFIMMKLDPETDGTDEGWVYGTVGVDGKSVTLGIKSCVDCHRDAEKDRVFGLPEPEHASTPQR